MTQYDIKLLTQRASWKCSNISWSDQQTLGFEKVKSITISELKKRVKKMCQCLHFLSWYCVCIGNGALMNATAEITLVYAYWYNSFSQLFWQDTKPAVSADLNYVAMGCDRRLTRCVTRHHRCSTCASLQELSFTIVTNWSCLHWWSQISY